MCSLSIVPNAVDPAVMQSDDLEFDIPIRKKSDSSFAQGTDCTSLADQVSKSVIVWLEEQVKVELVAMSRKLDELAAKTESKKCAKTISIDTGAQSNGSFRANSSQSAFAKTNEEQYVHREGSLKSAKREESFECAAESARIIQVKSVESANQKRVSFLGSGSEQVARLARARSEDSCTDRSSKSSANLSTKDTVLKRHRYESCWNFMEDPESSLAAASYSYVMQTIVVSSVVITILQTVDPAPIRGWGAAILETSIDLIFAGEFAMRFIFCPNKAMFVFHLFDMIDLVAALVILPRVIVGFNLDNVDNEIWRTFLLCFVPIIRMSKTLRRFQKLHLVVRAFREALEALPVLLWTLAVAVLVFSTAIYISEPRDNIENLPRAMWLTIVTMTTVGYGDVSPVSAAGALVTSLVIVVSLLYIAMPVGIIGQTFGDIWQDRDKILLMHQTRKKLMQWGYQAVDIPAIFALWDVNDSDEIELYEFREMMTEMGIGLAEERVIELFEFLDIDGGGGIDAREFVKQVFPDQFHTLYCMDKSADRSSRKGSKRQSVGYVRISGSNALPCRETLSPAARKSFAVRLANADYASPTNHAPLPPGNPKRMLFRENTAQSCLSHDAWS